MPDHYYSGRPSSASDRRKITAVLRGRDFVFITDKGVFSRAAVDFGSALLANAAHVDVGDSILDLGCGYGPVGIALAATVPDVTVWAVDVNERAVELCNINAEVARVSVHALVSDGVAALPKDIQFDCVVFNPPIRAGKSVVWRLYEQAFAVLRNGGRLFVVIQKKQGAESSETFLRSLFSEVRTIQREAGYRVYECKKE